MGENDPIDASAFARILKTVQLFLENNNLEETSQCLLKEIELKFKNSQLENVSPKVLVLRPGDGCSQNDSEIIISVGEKLNVKSENFNVEKQNSDLESGCPKCCIRRNRKKKLDSTEEDLYNLSEVINRLKEEYKTDSKDGDTYKTVNLTENGNQIGTLITHRVTEIIHLRHGYSCTCIQQPAESDDTNKGLGKSKSKEKNMSSQKLQGKPSKQSTAKIIDKLGPSNESLPPQVQERQSVSDNGSVKLSDEKKKKEKSSLLFKTPSKRKNFSESKVSESKGKENSVVQVIVSARSKPSNQEVVPPVSFKQKLGMSISRQNSPERISLDSSQEMDSVAIAVQDLDTKSKDATISPNISQISPAVIPSNDKVKSIISGNSQENAQTLQNSLASNEEVLKINSEKNVIKPKSGSIHPIKSVQKNIDDDTKNQNKSERSIKEQKSKNKMSTTVAAASVHDDVAIPKKSESNIPDKSQSPKKGVSINEIASLEEAVDEPQNVNSMINTSDKITSEKNSKEKTSPKGSETSRVKSQSLKNSVISNEIAPVAEAVHEEQMLNSSEKSQSSEITSEKSSKEKTWPKGSKISSEKSQSLKKSENSINQTSAVGEATHEPQEENDVINTSDKIVSEQSSKEKTSPKRSEASSDKSQSLKKSAISNEIEPVAEAVHEEQMLNSSEKSSLKSKEKSLKSPTNSQLSRSHSANKSVVTNDDNISKHSIVAAHGRITKEHSQIGEKSAHEVPNNTSVNSVEDNVKSKIATSGTSVSNSKHSSEKDTEKVIIRAAEKLHKSKQSIPTVASSTLTADIIKQKGAEKTNVKKKKRSLSCSKSTADSHVSLTEKKKKSKNEMKPQSISDDHGISKQSKSKVINDEKNGENEEEVDPDHNLNPMSISSIQVYSVSPNLKESQSASAEVVKEKEVKKKIGKKEKKSAIPCYSKLTTDSLENELKAKNEQALDSSSPNLKEIQTVNNESTLLKDNAIQTSFVMKVHDKKSNSAMLDNIPNKDIPLATTPLDYDKVKEDLLNGSLDEKLALLQALRWRITKANTQTRVRNLDSFTRYDLLGLEEIPIPSEESILNSYLCSEDTPNALQEDMARFLNALASLAKGREYLKNDTDFIINTLVPILMNQKEGVEIFDLTREFLLATVQKLSIDNNIRNKLISKGLLEWLVDYIITKHDNMTNYEADYSTALLANLCLEDDARERCLAIKDKVVEMLFVLVDTPHDCCLQYLNSILYSLMTKYDVNKLAMNKCLTTKLIDLHSKMKEPRKQKQLRDIIAIHTSVANEDVAFHKSQYPELIYIDHIEPELEMNDPVNQTPNGEELLRPYMLTGEKLFAAIKIMDESVRHSTSKRSKSSDAKKRKSDDESKKYGLNTMQSIEQRGITRNKGEPNNNRACTGRPTCCCRYCCYYSYCPPYRCYKEEQINTYSCECYNTIKDCSEEPSNASDAGAATSSLFHNYCGYYQYYPYCPQN